MLASNRRQYLLEFQHHDFRVRSEAERRSPRTGATRSENLHFADAAQPVNELAVDAPSHPTPGNELAKMGVAGKLKRKPCSLRDLGMIGGVSQENAGTVAINWHTAQSRGQIAVGCGVPVRHTDDLQPVDSYPLVLEHADPCGLHGIQIFGVVSELLMIACHKVDPVRRGKLIQWLGGVGGV